MYIFSEFLVSAEWSFGVNYPIICWLLTQHSRLIIWEKPQNFIEFYAKKSSTASSSLLYYARAFLFYESKERKNYFCTIFFLFLVQLDLSWSTFRYLNWQYYSCRNRDTFDSLELIKCLSLVLWPKGSILYMWWCI